MKNTVFFLLTILVTVFLFLIGHDVYECLWSKYGVLPMRKL